MKQRSDKSVGIRVPAHTYDEISSCAAKLGLPLSQFMTEASLAVTELVTNEDNELTVPRFIAVSRLHYHWAGTDNKPVLKNE